MMVMMESAILQQQDLKPKYTIRQIPLANLAITAISKTNNRLWGLDIGVSGLA